MPALAHHGCRRAAAVLLILAALAPQAARAQTPQADRFFRRQEFVNEETRRRLDAHIPTEQQILLTYGGYFIPQWQQYDDVDDQSNVRQLDLRLWGQVVVDDVHRIYARVKLIHTNFGPGDSPFGWNSDLEGPNLDQGFYELQLSEAVRRWCGAQWPADVRVTLGRQFVEFGRGLALSTILDGGTVDIETAQWRLRALLANTIHSDSNIDRSLQVEDHMDRLFGGVELSFLGLDSHRPYVYFVTQRDHTDEDPVNVAQEFDYDSTYIGLGSDGELLQNLRYATEAVFEFGRGYNRAAGPRNDIRAFAFDQLFEYFLEGPHEPVLSAEYALASGDEDRLAATATAGGNADSTDNAFLGFGYLNTGFAFAQEFTNLQFLRLGGSFKPLPDCRELKELEIGVDYFTFWRQKKDGPISDFRANTSSRDLGHEVDIYANWRILSDLSVIVRYARFWTGDAFDDGEKRDYMYAGMVYSF
jgi:hypothetical protein